MAFPPPSIYLHSLCFLRDFAFSFLLGQCYFIADDFFSCISYYTCMHARYLGYPRNDDVDGFPVSEFCNQSNGMHLSILMNHLLLLC